MSDDPTQPSKDMEADIHTQAALTEFQRQLEQMQHEAAAAGVEFTLPAGLMQKLNQLSRDAAEGEEPNVSGMRSIEGTGGLFGISFPLPTSDEDEAHKPPAE